MTILLKRIFDKIKLHDAPFSQQGTVHVTGVNGADLKVEGHAVMDIILDGHILSLCVKFFRMQYWVKISF